MATLSPATENFVSAVKQFTSTKTSEGAKIQVDYIASKVASFYEQIRQILEYQEEHLFRKKAIDRLLRRRLLLQESQKQNIAQPLISDLIRGGYLPNGVIPEKAILEARQIINKYTYFLNYTAREGLERTTLEDMNSWLISLASCEIEETLAPPFKDTALADYMYQVISQRITLERTVLHKEEFKAQVFIAVQKGLLRADNGLLNYRLIKMHFPQWTDNNNQKFIEAIAARLVPLKNAITAEINHPLAPKFFKVSNQYNTPFLVLSDALTKNPELLSKTAEEIENGVDQAYQERYDQLKKRLKRAAIYSTVSIFLTKVFIAIIIEIPLDLYVLKEFAFPTLAINILFPPFLMFLMVMTIKPPRAANAQKVIMETMKIIYQSTNQDQYEIRPSIRHTNFLTSFISFIYLIVFLLVYGAIIWVLRLINFSWPSVIIFIIFVSLIGFAGLKIRQRSKELNVESIKESGFSFLLDLFALPLVRVGKWLSGQWARFNIFVVIFNLLLEVPLLTFVEFLENWRHFMKEKKEEIQ